MRSRTVVKRIAFLVFAILAAAGIAAPARADSYVYSTQKREIKVCNLLLDSFRPRADVTGYNGLENADPHLFYILDSRADLKPRGWELVNPLAPRVVDQRIKDRWDTLDKNHPYQVGQRVTKNMACYWEVYLTDTSLEDLQQFDLIFVTSHIGTQGAGATATNVCFTAADREKLRKLVDMGGTIWMDDCWLMRIDNNPAKANSFFLDLNFAGASLAGFGGKPKYSAIVMDRNHPLLTSPFRLSDEEINHIGDKNVDDYRLTSLNGTALPDSILSPIVNNAGDFGLGAGRNPYVAGGHYGNGRILVTAGDTGCDINDLVTGGPFYRQTVLNPSRPDPNGGAYCGTNTWLAPTEDLKFVYNMLNWSSGDSNYRQGPRRTAFTREELTAPLDTSWKVLLSGETLSASPVTWRNITYFGTDNGTIYAMDARPSDDRDGDGIANDGLLEGIDGVSDLTPATPYDVIWKASVGDKVTGLYVATVTIGGVPQNVLFVTTATGKVHALDAWPVNPETGKLQATTSKLVGYPLTVGAGASAPVVSQNRLMIVARDSGKYRLYVMNAANGVSIPGSPIDLENADPGDTSVLAPIAVGLVRNENNGGVADLAYATLPNGALAAVAFQVHDETADPRENGKYDADPTLFRLQHAYVRDRSLQVREYDENNNLVTTPLTVTDPGISYQVKIISGGQPIPASHRIAVDYTVDIALDAGKRKAPNYTYAQGYPVSTNAKVPILSGATIGADDTTYYATGNGIIQAVAERGGASENDKIRISDYNRVLWRYNLNKYVRVPGPGQPPTEYQRGMAFPAGSGTSFWAAACIDNVTNCWRPLAPAITDTMTYIAMNAYDPTGGKYTLLGGAVFGFDQHADFYLALDPATAALPAQMAHVEGNPNVPLTSRAIEHGKTRLWQYSPESEAPGWKEIKPEFWDVDYARNRIIFKCFDGNLTICPSLPVWVDLDGDGIQHPDWQDVDGDGVNDPVRDAAFQINGGVANLVWQYPDPRFSKDVAGNILPACDWSAGVSSSPTISGDVLYVGTGDGRLFALDADPRDGVDTQWRAPNLPDTISLNDDGWSETSYLLQSLKDPGGNVVPWLNIWPRRDPTDNSKPFLPDLSQPVPPDVLWAWSPLLPGQTGNVPEGTTATSSTLVVPFNVTDAASNPVGSMVYSFVEPIYMIGDANRMVQVDRQGRVVWMMNEAITRVEKSTGTVAYGVAPNQITTVQKALNRPASAGKLSADTVLISDTGNDRVIAVDRGGAVIWEASEMYDPLGILPTGEFQIGAGYGGETNVRVAHLSNPTDAVQWVSYYQPDPSGAGKSDVTVRHTLIADAGNYRVLEIVDMFRPGAPGYLPRAGGGYWYHVIVWASQTNVGHRDPWGRWQAGQKYQYTSVQPITYTKDGYTVRALCTVSNYALSRVDGRRQQRLGASLVILESRDTVGASRDWTKPANFRSYLVDVPDGEQGYVSLIGAPGGLMRSLDRPATIRRFRYKWGSSGQEWHDLYADATGIYEWQVPADGKLPMVTNAQGQQCINPGKMYRQFWPETYQRLWSSNSDVQATFRFEPASVSLLPDGGWLVANRVFDRALSNTLRDAGRTEDARRVQIFKLDTSSYNNNPSLNFGFKQSDLNFLFGPQLRDLKTGNDLGLDLVNPMYAVRTE